MPRIRSVKPEFWEDETVGLLSVHARLLFIATWNLADDEGLLRWTAAYIKASVFMYDDVSIADVQRFMAELVDHKLLFPYRGGKTQQELAHIVRFRRHQRINRPQAGKLPPPSLQSNKVRDMYAERDGWTCHLCGGVIPDAAVHGGSKVGKNLQIDHLEPRSHGGTDYPSNLAASHETCNKRRHTKALPERDADIEDEMGDADIDSLSDSVNGSVSDAVRGSVAEGKGGEQGEEEEVPPSAGRDAPAADPPTLTLVSSDTTAALEPTAPPAPPPPSAQPVTAQTLLGEHLDACPHRPPKRVVGHLSGEIKKLLGEGIDPVAVRGGLAILRDRGLDPSKLPSTTNQTLNPPAPRRGYSRASPDGGTFDYLRQLHAEAQAREGG